MTNIYEPENAFLEAENNWQLEKLYADLERYEYKQTQIDNAYLRGLLLGLSPEEIAKALGVTLGTVSERLSDKLRDSVKSLLESKQIKTGKNVPWLQIQRKLRAEYQKSQIQSVFATIENSSNPFIYLKRGKIESLCLQEIQNPGGCLIRLRSSWLTGKTLLINRILSQIESIEYLTIKVSCRLANQETLSNLDSFLEWFCEYISEELNILNEQQLQISGNSKYHWRKTLGSKTNCNKYFLINILPQIPGNLVLVLDDIDLIYTENPKIAEDFFELLRYWRQEANTYQIWKKLRLVLAYSRRIYFPNINKSPFNAGEIELPEFDIQEVRNLAQMYELNLETDQYEQLMAMFGGYTFLVQKALAQISSSVITFQEFLDQAPTEKGIYKDHLLHHKLTLQQYPDLMAAMKKVVNAAGVVELQSEQAYQLEAMGLVKLQDTNLTATPRCKIYHLYFRQCL